jgi:Holliday junction resolvase RusA-like endonuclease
MREINIPGKPVPAARPKVSKFGTYYPKAHMTHKAVLDTFFKGAEPYPVDQPVEVRTLFVMPRYKTSDHPVHRSDVDNLAKLPLDCMTQAKDGDTGKFWTDDDLIVDLRSLKRFCREGEEPHTKVRIIPIHGSVEDHVDASFYS